MAGSSIRDLPDERHRASMTGCSFAITGIETFRARMLRLGEDEPTRDRLARFVERCERRGVAVHDANVAATALTHGMPSPLGSALNPASG